MVSKLLKSTPAGDLGEPSQRVRASVAHSEPYLNIFGSESTQVQTAGSQQAAVDVTVALESTFIRAASVISVPSAQAAPETAPESQPT